jgi:hypothetical protein
VLGRGAEAAGAQDGTLEVGLGQGAGWVGAHNVCVHAREWDSGG